MTTPMDREGTARIQIIDYTMREFASGSVCISLRANVTGFWDNDQWQDWREYGVTVEGDVFIINKQGQLLDRAVQSLINHAGWDGDFRSANDGSWKPTPCQCTIKANEFNGITSYKINFINSYDQDPARGGGLTPEKARELANKFGPAMRALAGNVQRNAPPPDAAKPIAPSRPAALSSPPAPAVEPPF